VRTIRYQEIAQVLRERIAEVGTGRVLPSESDLSAEFGVSRVTVRRALETLREEGLVESRQGFGWYAAAMPLQQRLTQLETIERQLEERGMHPERQVIEFAFVDAPAHVAAQLQCESVLRVKRVNRADGEPFAIVTVWCPAELGQHMSRADVERWVGDQMSTRVPLPHVAGATIAGARLSNLREHEAAYVVYELQPSERSGTDRRLGLFVIEDADREIPSVGAWPQVGVRSVRGFSIASWRL